MKIKKEECIGCGLCEQMYPELFVLEEGKAVMKKVAKLDKDLAKKAEYHCPCGCIYI